MTTSEQQENRRPTAAPDEITADPTLGISAVFSGRLSALRHHYVAYRAVARAKNGSPGSTVDELARPDPARRPPAGPTD